MKKFLLIVIGTVGLGLAIRFTINKPDKPKPKPTPVAPAVQVEPPPPPPPDPRPESPPPPPAPPEPPASPRIIGSTMITDASTQHYAAAPGVVYYCDGGNLMAAPKDGSAPRHVGECEGQVFDFVADAQAVFYCDNDKLKRVTHGTEGSHVVVDNVECIMSALDGSYAYYVVPVYADDDPEKVGGVFRVARGGGAPEPLVPTKRREQFILSPDTDALWVAGVYGGMIWKLPKTRGAKLKSVISGQKLVVDLAHDDTWLYWHVEQGNELRRRKKKGGAIEVLDKEVTQEPVLVVDGHVYWFSGADGEPKRLMHLEPGVAVAKQLAEGLRTPTMRADAEGVYVSELDREGIFMFKR
jgi:hypothetical protein